MKALKLSKWNHPLFLFAAALMVTAASLVQVRGNETSGPILTPLAGPAAKINGPKIYGARPGHFFVYRVPCTGRRPIHFSAEGLPSSLHLDKDTGIITGNTPERRGEYLITLHAANEQGNSVRPFKLVVGDTLALTPPMGWNDWYTYYDRITEKVVREAADTMNASGMADFGYQYVDIDDCWMRKPGSKDPMLTGPERSEAGAILPNRRFPDMNGLTAHIHALGLKAGIYTSPGPMTCGQFMGSYQHEQQDADQFANWGFDFLKYDWCYYSKVAPHPTLEDYQRPYRLMGGILKKLDRDVVLNLCQYGMGDSWNWAADTGGQLWRTTGDLGAVKGQQLPGFYQIGFANAEHFPNAGPGRWNDPDYILIGYVGNAFHDTDPPTRTALTPDEQYTYMSMWSLMASPLFYSGVMSHLDAFTLNVLCNSEVIDIDQDVLGKQAKIVRHTGQEFVLSKPLEDGALAVGLFNLAKTQERLTVTWQELGLNGRCRIRDVWRQKDVGDQADQFSTEVGPHGVVLIHLARID
ncbi:MAG TPA: putative Ig domain-containing protein [Terriglobia bacterium]|nr:putative Ig domain-containing protein [Terriglobia bacterium]